MFSVSIPIAFVAGMLSFLSPCVLPILPGFLGYLQGLVGKGRASGADKHDRVKLFANSLAFVLGFGITFTLLGVLINGIFAQSSMQLRTLLSQIGGAVIVFFGLFVLGLIKVPALENEYKLPAKKTRFQYLTSAIFGISFAVGWTPCVGAVLGSIITLAATDAGGAVLPMVAYSAGLGVPFLIVGALGGEAIALLNRFKGLLKYFNIITGILLIILGILIFTQQLNVIANFILPQELYAYFSGVG